MSDPGGNSGNNSKMHPRDRGVDEQETLRRQLEAFQSGLWTALPVIMKKHNSDANTVGVQPAIKLAHAQPDGQLKWLQIPELHDLPIQYYGGGGATIVPPMKEGDEGLVVFASRTMDKWWQQGGVQEQTEARMHDLSDGWFLPGGRSQPRKLKDINPNEWQLRTDDGKTHLSLDPASGKFSLKAPNSPFQVDSDLVVNPVDQIILRTKGGKPVRVEGDLLATGKITALQGSGGGGGGSGGGGGGGGGGGEGGLTSITLTGDVIGTGAETIPTTVVQLQGRPIDPIAPIAGNYLGWDVVTSRWKPLPGGAQGPIGPIGLTGPIGPTGATGATGPAGAGSYQPGAGIAFNLSTTPPTISTAVPYLPLTGGALTGRLTIQSDSSVFGGNFVIYNTGAGATNPAKWFRLSNTGTLEIVNSAFSAVIFQLSDQGNLTLAGPYLYGLGATGGVNGVGGPFIYFDSNYIIPHLGTGNVGFVVQNSAGTNIGGFASDGWLLGLGSRRVILNDGNYTQIKDGSDRTAVQLGSTLDPQTYYRNTTHNFQGVNGAGYLISMSSAGVTVQNSVAFRGLKNDNATVVNLAYIDGFNNVIIGGYGSALYCFVGSGGSYFSSDGTFYPVTNIVLQNNTYIYGNYTTSTPYPLLGVTSGNRLNINPSALWVDAGGPWTFGNTIFNTASNVATGAFHMSPNASGTAYGSFWYNDGGVTYLLLTNNNDALGSYNGLRPFYVDNASGLVIMGHGLNLSGGALQLAGVSFAAQDATYHYLYDKSGRAAILLGGSGDSSNYYRNSVHSFVGINGAGGTQLKVDGSFQSSQSPNAGYFFADRTSAGLNWGVYAIGTLLRFWNSGHGDLATMDSVGNLFLLNSNFLYGRQSNGTDLQLCGVADRNYFGNGTLDTHIRATTWCYFSGHPVPAADNTYICGYPGSAWTQVIAYAYPGPSDVRLKHEIEDLPDDCLDLVRAITPRRYKFRNAPEQDRDRKRWGFIAQEVAEAMAARGHDFGGHFVGDDPAQSQALDHSDLLAVLWHAMGEMADRLAVVEGRA